MTAPAGAITAPSGRSSVLGGEQDPFAEQRQPGPPEHLPFDHFDVVDAAFDGPEF
jgi:hypothetical protein